MGLKANDTCLQKAQDWEWIFVLLSRDDAAPATIVEWIKLSLYDQPAEKLHEALECAIQMEKQRRLIIKDSDGIKLFSPEKIGKDEREFYKPAQDATILPATTEIEKTPDVHS